MLTEQRYDIILKLLEEKNSITVAEVKELLNTSESTVRRDITALHNAGKLVKVFGGAVACDRTIVTHEPTVEQKAAVNVEAKQLVAARAAALIQPEDFVYLDAGTTTASMLSFLTEKSAIFVTNAVAQKVKSEVERMADNEDGQERQDRQDIQSARFCGHERNGVENLSDNAACKHECHDTGVRQYIAKPAGQRIVDAAEG